jgi:hypothetical protein
MPEAKQHIIICILQDIFTEWRGAPLQLDSAPGVFGSIYGAHTLNKNYEALKQKSSRFHPSYHP